MPQTVKAPTQYEARLLNNPSDPRNSSWELLIDDEYIPDHMTPSEMAIRGDTYEECLKEATAFLEERGQDLTALVIARLEVAYILPDIPGVREGHTCGHCGRNHSYGTTYCECGCDLDESEEIPTDHSDL